MKKTLALFSGGKDSFYSIQKVLEKGNLDLIVSVSSASGDTQLHAGPEVTREIRRAQLQGIDIPHHEIAVGAGKNYLNQLFAGLQELVQKNNIGYVVTGDLWHPYTNGIGDMLAGALDVDLVRPAKEDCPSKNQAIDYMKKILDSDIRGIVVSVREGTLPREYLGREINCEFLSELKSMCVDVAAESGEYQSLVIASPIMKGRIVIDDYSIDLVHGKNGIERFHRMKINKFSVEYEK